LNTFYKNLAIPVKAENVLVHVDTRDPILVLPIIVLFCQIQTVDHPRVAIREDFEVAKTRVLAVLARVKAQESKLPTRFKLREWTRGAEETGEERLRPGVW
jgi:hypothetical protein